MADASMTAPAPGASLEGDGPAPVRLGHTIVVGNEKGGAGKSTVAMHLSIALLRMGMTVII